MFGCRLCDEADVDMDISNFKDEPTCTKCGKSGGIFNHEHEHDTQIPQPSPPPQFQSQSQSQSQNSATNEIKISFLSFNLSCFKGCVKASNRDKDETPDVLCHPMIKTRMEACAKIINEENPDILLLQEMVWHLQEPLYQRITDFYDIYEATNMTIEAGEIVHVPISDKCGVGDVVCVRKGKGFKVVRQGSLMFSSKQGAQAPYLVVELSNGHKILVSSTHLDSHSSASHRDPDALAITGVHNRNEQMEEVSEQLTVQACGAIHQMLNIHFIFIFFSLGADSQLYLQNEQRPRDPPFGFFVFRR